MSYTSFHLYLMDIPVFTLYITSALYYSFNPYPQKGISSPRHFFFLLRQRITFSLYCIIGFIVGNSARGWIPSCHFITGRPMSDTWNGRRSCPHLMRDQMLMMTKMQQTILWDSIVSPSIEGKIPRYLQLVVLFSQRGIKQPSARESIGQLSTCHLTHIKQLMTGPSWIKTHCFCTRPVINCFVTPPNSKLEKKKWKMVCLTPARVSSSTTWSFDSLNFKFSFAKGILVCRGI